MRFSDAQIVALIGLVGSVCLAAGGWLASKYGKGIDLHIKREELQTTREGQLQLQITALNARMDAAHIAATTRLDAKEKEWMDRYEMQDKRCEERLDALEREMKELQTLNKELRGHIESNLDLIRQLRDEIFQLKHPEKA